jgi:hypothetical protein
MKIHQVTQTLKIQFEFRRGARDKSLAKIRAENSNSGTSNCNGKNKQVSNDEMSINALN